MTNPAGWACPPAFPENHYFRQGKSLCGRFGYKSKNPANFKKDKSVPTCELCRLELHNRPTRTEEDGAYEVMRAKVSDCVEMAEQKYGAKWPEVRESIREMLTREMAKRRVKSMEAMAEHFAADSDPNWRFALIAAAFRKNDPLTKS